MNSHLASLPEKIKEKAVALEARSNHPINDLKLSI